MASRSNPHPQALTALIGMLSIACLASYAYFLFAPWHIGHPVPYVLLVIAEIIGMINVLGIWLPLVVSPGLPSPPDVSRTRSALVSGKRKPSVAVFITVAGEDLGVLKRTVKAAVAMDVAHRTVVLDDGGSDDVKEAVTALGAEYLTRPRKDGRKAGNVNYGLSQVHCDFFAILDCDHVPKKGFLAELLPYLVADPKLAFVQSPQFFGNTDTFVAGGSAETQEVFYQHIQPRKNLCNAAFCTGTNVVFRTKAVKELGGMYDKSASEDIWTSLLLHERGWKSLFIPTVLATGETPDTVDSYFRQQTRWAKGGFEILLTHNPLLSDRLTWGQALQYAHTCLYYLSGFAVVIYFVLPLLYVYFGWKPVDAPNEPFAWILRFLPYYVMTFVSNMYLLGRAPMWRSFVVTITAFPAHITAFLSALTGKNLRWSATGTIKRQRDYVTAVAPHMLIFLLTVGAIPVLILRPIEQPLTYVFVVWMTWNAAAMFSIIKRAIPRYAHEPQPKTTSYYYAT